ncbi:MAG: hypothetical protein IJZ63_05000, partial [Clostridia bacterium]|nr:hypothetical protein [Clostridia bacterium]
MTKTFKEYKADADKQNAELKKNDLGSIDNSADAAIKLAEDTYKKAEANTIADYASDYERNAVQKLINEKKIAETNANLGLTDSGLNRTQQTAVQLSYANQKGKLDLARQQALDKLSSDLASYVTGINNQREADKLSVNQFYDQQSNTIATELYDTDVELNKAAIEASAKGNATPQKIYWFRGVSDENGKYLYYNTETGKTEEVPPYMNPYNSNDNRITYSAEYNDKNIGFFQLADGTPGYQPRGLVSEGGKFSKATVGNTVVKYDLYDNGKNNTIWKSKTGKFFI